MEGAAKPLAIPAKYTTPGPDDPVELYRGVPHTELADVPLFGTGAITLHWQPSPRVEFHLDVDPPVPVELDEAISEPQKHVELRFPDYSGRGKATAWGSSWTHEAGGITALTLRGIIEEFVVGNPAPVVGGPITRSPVPGRVWAGRIRATTPTWSLVLDELEVAGDLRKFLDRSSGYGITSVGELRRVDGLPVQYESVDDLMELLAWWLSMLRSERTGPVLLIGMHDGVEVWECWKVPVVDAWHGRQSWLPYQPTTSLEGDFPGAGTILTRLEQLVAGSEEHRAVTRALGWYTRSVHGVDLEPTVIAAQAGLEVLSWLHLTTEAGLSEDGFNKLTAADVLRLTLNRASIQPAVPAHATHLHGATRQSPQGPELDGPAAITEIRNGVVHPKGTGRLAADTVIYEGGRLAIRYLELLLLHRLGYAGQAFDRIAWSETQDVPWK